MGDNKNAHSPGFNDRTWKNIDLPHDWVISQPFSRGAEGGWTPQNMQGFFAWEGICWYRKEIILQEIEKKSYFIYFGGTYRNSTVYINGKEAAKRANGYLSYDVDITEHVKEGKNLIAVRLDNGCEEPDRWYSGSGIYRNVFLRVVPETQIKTWGVSVKSQISKNYKQADVTVTTEITQKTSRGDAETQRTQRGNNYLINVSIFNKNNKCVSQSSESFKFDKKDETNVTFKFKIQNPELWSAENPNLYRIVVSIENNGINGDSKEVNFGIRNVEIEYKKGITVNGQKIKLKGVCLHHEAGITGSAYYDDVWRRRLLTLKSIGCNAIRTSHNPPAEEFLDLCDEMGFYVINECFDKWKSGYYANHFDADAERDLTDFILRDRNHPSVFMWSVGNEVENQGQDSMIAIQKKLVDIVRKLDDRPVTCALAPHANPRTLVGAPPAELVKLTMKLAKDVDILGLNYHEPLYPYYTKDINKPIVGTECYEYYSSVGTNFEDVCDKNPWVYVQENDNVIGQFIWAGIDYLGECPYPAKGWSGSILDICGFMKPNAYYRKSIWTSEPMIYMGFYDQYLKPDYARGRWSFPQISSHLNHDYFNRRTVTLAVFTNCQEAELWVNGKKRGRRSKADFKNGIIEWTIEYTTGALEVKGFNDGKEVCSYDLKTAQQAKKIKLSADKTELKPGGIAHIEVNITDKDGLLCANDESFIEFSLSGDALLLGSCSSDLNQNLGFTSPKTAVSGGKALAVIKAGSSSGTVELRVYSEKLENAVMRFKVK